METKDILIKKLEQMGGKYWAKGAMERMYFPAQVVFKMDINRYGSGRIASATADGERISNAEADRCLGVGLYIDLASTTVGKDDDGRVTVKNVPTVCVTNAHLPRSTRHLLDKFVARLTEIIHEETKEEGE